MSKGGKIVFCPPTAMVDNNNPYRGGKNSSINKHIITKPTPTTAPERRAPRRTRRRKRRRTRQSRSRRRRKRMAPHKPNTNPSKTTTNWSIWVCG